MWCRRPDSNWRPTDYKSVALPTVLLRLYGGAREDRTPDLLRARQALSQLSYGPMVEREGFEPSVRYRTPAFQASKLNHSDISPMQWWKIMDSNHYNLSVGNLANCCNTIMRIFLIWSGYSDSNRGHWVGNPR